MSESNHRIHFELTHTINSGLKDTFFGYIACSTSVVRSRRVMNNVMNERQNFTIHTKNVKRRIGDGSYETKAERGH